MENYSSHSIDDTSPQASRFESRVVSSLFIATILVFTGIGLTMPFRACPAFSEVEKRKLSQFPAIDATPEHIYKFASGFESFYNDHFPARLFLTSLENTINYEAFHTSGRSLCTFGHRDWIFYSNGLLPVAQQNLNPFEDDQLADRLAMYKARRDILASKNIKYVVMIAPEKGTVYPEFMPHGWKRRAGRSRLEQLQSEFQSHHVSFVNALGAIVDSKGVGKWLYFSNDSHWNDYGAFQVAQSLFSILALDFSQINPFGLNEYELDDSEHIGDMAIALALQRILVDRRSPTVRLKNSIASGGGAEPPLKFSEEKLPAISESDSPVLETPLALISASGAPLRAFVLHDSFMAFLRAYLAKKFSFSEYHAVHTLSPKIVFERKPDVVIDQIAERHLYDRAAESVPLFVIEKPEDNSPDSKLPETNLNIDFGDRLTMKSVWSKWTRNGLHLQVLWSTKKEQKLDTFVEASDQADNIKSTHVQDFYQRKLPAGTLFVDTFTLPLGDSSHKQTLEIELKTSSAQDAPTIGKYQFTLEKIHNKKSPVEALATSYSSPGEIFN